MSHHSAVEDVISLKSRVIHRFYEPIVLRLALSLAARETAMSVPPEKPIDFHNEQEVYEAFVYKLAHVCDTKKGEGGATVTSFMVLQGETNEKAAQYWFASNQRTTEELEDTAHFVRILLEKIRGVVGGSSNQDALHTDILRHVLTFNRSRIELYVNTMRRQLRECMQWCSENDGENSNLIAHGLEELTECVTLELSPRATQVNQVELIEICEKAINQLRKLRDSEAGPLILVQSQQGRMLGYRSQECWSELQHTMNRIIAYHESVNFFLRARKKWPGLFREFDVNFVPSSKPMDKPCRNKSLSAESIVGRMTNKADILKEFKKFVRTLQNFDLDERIKAEYRKDTFRPIVHSEVLLFNWLERSGDASSRKFFNNFRYIGSSKPSCILCEYYFKGKRTGIGHRPSHGNLYISWRVPDLLRSQGEAGEQSRQLIMNRMMVMIRNDTFDLVKQKVPFLYKKHDSNTFSAMMTHQESWTVDGSSHIDIDDAASLIGRMSLSG